MTASTYRDERRKDRAAQAQIDREDEAARSKLRTAERKAAQDRKLAASKARAARRADAARWCSGHAADLMLAPVIAASLVLSWTGMASYGTADYGLTGLVLPVISEGGAWAFAFAAAICARSADPRLWACRVGVIVFAGAGAALNFLHGDANGGVTVGATMAIVSVAGITAHQLIKAGPQRSRIDRRIARRIRQAQQEAVDAAPVEVDADGCGRLVMDTAPAVPVDSPESVPEPPETITPDPSQPKPTAVTKAVTVAVNNDRHGTLMLSFIPPVRMPTESPTAETTEQQVKPPVKPAAETPEKVGANPTEKRRAATPLRRGKRPDKVAALLAKGGLTNAQIAQQANVSERTVERRRSALREESEAASGVVNLDDRRRA